jgi:hypothetical protein
MWPFKKKAVAKVESSNNIESILCIPGNWTSWDDFILKIIAVTQGEYICAGGILMNAKEKQHFKIEFCEHDQKMKSSFQYAGMINRVSENFLNEIGSHTYVVYIIGDGGSLEKAEQIAKAGSAVLKAGGLGLKVETAGKAFEKDHWISLVENIEVANLYRMFVIDSISDSDGKTFSCGMHNIGLKDTIVAGEDFQEAVKLISIFSFYQLIDKPQIVENQTFSCDINSPRFRITNEVNQPYKEDNLFKNPFGMWRLSKI